MISPNPTALKTNKSSRFLKLLSTSPKGRMFQKLWYNLRKIFFKVIVKKFLQKKKNQFKKIKLEKLKYKVSQIKYKKYRLQINLNYKNPNKFIKIFHNLK